MLSVELEYECILVQGVAGRKTSLHHLGCFLTKTPLGPVDVTPIKKCFYNQISNNKCLV